MRGWCSNTSTGAPNDSSSNVRGRRGLISHRVALLVGSLLRIPLLAALPGRRAELATRTQIARRILRVRTRSVERLPKRDGQSDQAARNGDLIVCSLEAWDEVWRRNQFLVRELLAADPTRRVLFVEPPVDVLNDLRRGRRPRSARIRRVTADPRVTLFTPVKVLPRVLNPWADRRLAGKVMSAAPRLGVQGPDAVGQRLGLRGAGGARAGHASTTSPTTGWRLTQAHASCVDAARATTAFSPRPTK